MIRCTVLFLAGGPSQPPLQASMGFPVAGLPLDAGRTLLSCWLGLIERSFSAGPDSIHVLTSCSRDADWFSAELRRAGGIARSVDVRVDARGHRGVCGLLADTVAAIAPADWLLVVELNSLPPASLRPILRESGGADVPLLVGGSRDSRPSGVFRLRTELLAQVPRLGYLDLKEQFIPQLVARGRRVELAELAETAVRLTDRRNYLRAIRIWQSMGRSVGTPPSIAGNSLVCDGVEISPGGFVLDSVVLPGATIGRGSVVARSVIGPLMKVPDQAVLVDAVMANPSLGSIRTELRSSSGAPSIRTPSDAVAKWSI